MKRLIQTIGAIGVLLLSATPVSAFELSTGLSVLFPIPTASPTPFPAETSRWKIERESQVSDEQITSQEASLAEVKKLIAVPELKTAGNDVVVLPISADNTIGISTYFTRFHHGIDIRAPIGAPVRSVHAGKVIEVAYQAYGYGRHIVLAHEENGAIVHTLYAHLKSMSIQIGDTVQAGDTIGYVGLTGRTTGPHLHFEIYADDIAFDPIRYFTKGLPEQFVAKK